MWLTGFQVTYFDLVPEAVARRVRFHRVPWLWTGGVTIGRHIFLRRGYHLSSDLVIAHELVHAGQYAKQGTVGFLRAILNDYLRLRVREGWPHRVARFRMSSERSARHVAGRWAQRKGVGG